MTEDWLQAKARDQRFEIYDSSVELLSHDIRSALSDVLSGLRLVDFSGLDPATAAQLQRVSTAGQSLAQLLDSALRQLGAEGLREIEELPSDTHPTHDDPVPLLAVIRNLERRWAGHARERSMSLRLDIAADLPTVLYIDAVALDRLLANLLSNAFKYADWGQVTLMVDMRDGEELRFRVRDEGPGFSDEALAQLFQRGGRPQGQTRPGSGLGLHIAKELASHLCGQLQVANGVPGGAEVSLLLPYAAWAHKSALSAASAHSDEPPPLPDLSGLTALVAEDNPTNQLLFTQMLDHLGANYRLAEDGARALELLMEGGYDFALIDIDMPKLSGIEVIARTRAMQDDTRLLPILAVTAYVLQEHREQIYSAGADGILAKPVHSLAAFGQAIATLMRRTQGATPEILEAAQAPTCSCRPANALDEGNTDNGTEGGRVQGAYLEDHRDFCPNRLEKLISISGADGGHEFLTRLHFDLRRTRSSLSNAVAKQSAAGIRAQTHVIISLSGAVGAQALQDLASRANAAAHRSEGSNTALNYAEKIDTKLAGLVDAIACEHKNRFGEDLI